jgi:hypothetical protein
MKKLDATTIRDMAEATASMTMLAAMGARCVRFIRAYMAPWKWYQLLSATPFSTYTYAGKGVVTKIVHDRKFALFQRCGGQGFQ